MEARNGVLAVIAAVWGALAATAVGAAAGEDRAAEQLAAARVRYEAAMEKVREGVTRSLRAALDAAGRPGRSGGGGGVDADEVRKLGEQMDAFRERGDWPDVRSAGTLREQKRRAEKVMLDAYAVAAAAYAKEGQNELRDAVLAELEAFKTQADLAPWGQNAVADLPEPRRTLSEAGGPLELADVGLAGEYRLEVLAKRAEGGTGEEGTLVLGLPLAEGGVLRVPAAAGERGDIRVLVSVRKGLVSADLGLARPIDVGRAEPSEGTALTLAARGGTVVVESVRVKPVIEGGLEDAPARPAAERERAREERPDPYTAGRSWVGNCKIGTRTIRLTKREGDRVTFQTGGEFQGSLWRISGRLRSGVVVVDDIERLKSPPGHAPVSTREPKGSIRINTDGTLDMDCEVRGSNGRVNNWSLEFRCRGAKPL